MSSRGPEHRPHTSGEQKMKPKNASSGMSKAMLPANSRGERWGTTYVVVRGKLGPEGWFGSLGSCKRVLEVIEILEAKDMRGRK